MSIQIRQLSIKSSVLQNKAGAENAKEPFDSCSGAQLSEENKSEIIEECRSILLDLLSRNRER